ncbi:SEC10 [Candida pseudojiufengensis]|uniref:SEC10 n=1 Tax=Candida pseudojiufengensis TaxID=497109 RepID=UPI0022241B02|nr:SEC10 [Candida pseudojiufengensis]KAI5965982.1 SEC10 [Candida pseudojiufengensis]
MSGGSFSIYELNPEIKKLLSANNFLNGLPVNDFIEEISKDHILKGAEVNKHAYLDPKPYIRSFESTIRELNQLNLEANDQRIRGEKQVDSFELNHSNNVLKLSQSMKDITNEFSKLDDKISLVSSKVNPLGTKLNKISTSRDKSKETIFLIRAYHGFYTKGQYPQLETLRSSNNTEDNVECAKYIRQLIHLAKRISDESLSKTIKCLQDIESFGDKMEEELLKKFDIATGGDDESDFDIKVMNKIATILNEYNKNVNLMEAFVSKNELSKDNEDMDLTITEDQWKEWADPNSNIELEDKFKLFLQNLKFDIKSKARLSKKIFDNPIVLVNLIQRIYGRVIKPKISELLQYSLQFNLLAHVRILHELYDLLGEFTNQIKDYMITEEYDSDQQISQTLESSYNKLFAEYLGDTYLSREKKNLEEVVHNILNKFDSESFNDQTHGNLGLERSDTVEYTKKEYDHTTFAAERKRLAQFTQYVKNKINERTGNERNISKLELEEDDLAAIDTVEKIIKAAAESLSRALELNPERASDHSLEVLNVLVINFAKLIVREELQLQNLNIFWSLNSIHFKKEILFCLSTSAKKIILPSLSNDQVSKNKAKSMINGFVKIQENSINQLVDKLVDYSLNQLQNLLNKQKKKDFLCDTIGEDTEACELISEFLNEMYTNVSVVLSNQNLINTLTTIGNKFLQLLLEHFKKFQVNSIGGIVLTKDAIRYQSVIDEWNIPDLSERYQILKEIGNLFTVQEELINSLVTEGQLSRMKPYNIRQYISKRKQ